MHYETKPIDDSRKDGNPFVVATSMRWLAYKPGSEQYRRGLKGRWQIANEFGWENLVGDGPTEYLSPCSGPTSMLVPAEARTEGDAK